MAINIDQWESRVDMRAYLRRLGEEGVIYFKPNPGNAGDAMIAHATYQLFNELGLDYRLIGSGSIFFRGMAFFGKKIGDVAAYRSGSCGLVVLHG